MTRDAWFPAERAARRVRCWHGVLCACTFGQHIAQHIGSKDEDAGRRHHDAAERHETQQDELTSVIELSRVVGDSHSHIISTRSRLIIRETHFRTHSSLHLVPSLFILPKSKRGEQVRDGDMTHRGWLIPMITIRIGEHAPSIVQIALKYILLMKCYGI